MTTQPATPARVASLERIIRALVWAAPWRADDTHLSVLCWCDWCDAKRLSVDWRNRPTFADHQPTCPWRLGREAIGAGPDEEWEPDLPEGAAG